MIKNAIRVRYNVLKAGIEKYVPPVDLSGIGEVVIETVDFSNNQGMLTVVIQTSGTIKGVIKLIGELVLKESKESIIFDVQDIEFVKLPLALKLTAGLLKRKIISMIESRAKITDQQLLSMLNNGTKGILSSLSSSKGIDAAINLTDLKFVYIIKDNEGIEICTELKAEPMIDIKELP